MLLDFAAWYVFFIFVADRSKRRCFRATPSKMDVVSADHRISSAVGEIPDISKLLFSSRVYFKIAKEAQETATSKEEVDRRCKHYPVSMHGWNFSACGESSSAAAPQQQLKNVAAAAGMGST